MIFYDGKGRTIQSRAENYLGGEDIMTNRYDFSGKLVSNYWHQSMPSNVTLNSIRLQGDTIPKGVIIEEVPQNGYEKINAFLEVIIIRDGKRIIPNELW